MAEFWNPTRWSRPLPASTSRPGCRSAIRMRSTTSRSSGGSPTPRWPRSASPATSSRHCTPPPQTQVDKRRSSPQERVDRAGRQAEVSTADAGRQAEVIAALPICVTDDPAKARTTAAEIYAVYGTLPSYRAMLDREGAAGPADIAIIGDEQAATERIEEIRATGVAEISAHVFGSNPEDRDRTRAFLRPPQALPRSNSIPAD